MLWRKPRFQVVHNGCFTSIGKNRTEAHPLNSAHPYKMPVHLLAKSGSGPLETWLGGVAAVVIGFVATSVFIDQFG